MKQRIILDKRNALAKKNHARGKILVFGNWTKPITDKPLTLRYQNKA